MLLKELFKSVDILNPEIFLNNYNLGKIDILNLSFNSENILPGYVFVCLKGSNFDGHNFYKDAIKNGAVCIVASKKLVDVPNDIPVILVKDTRKSLADISANFFKHPAKEIKVIGITGTKGKTSTSFMINSVLNAAGFKSGIIGTLGIFLGSNFIKTNNTTPESYYVQKYLRRMVDNGFKYAVIEVSSIGIKTHRLDNVHFECAVFTNFSLDHIGKDEHKNKDEYLESKALLFSRCSSAFINLDDEKSGHVAKRCKCKDIRFFSINKKNSDLLASNIKLVRESDNFGVSFETSGLLELKVNLGILGKFNVYNALAAILVAHYLGVNRDNIIFGLKNVKIKGRMEVLPVPSSFKFKILIDYAHNSLSMENLLTTLREYNPKRLVVVFGSGGNRPKIRRYQLGETSGRLADLSILTADNSRFENTSDIIKDIEVGIKKTNGKYIVILDRREAIKYAIFNAKKGDLIVLAGKGHEDYEEVKGIKRPFSERNIVKRILSELQNS